MCFSVNVILIVVIQVKFFVKYFFSHFRNFSSHFLTYFNVLWLISMLSYYVCYRLAVGLVGHEKNLNNGTGARDHEQM